MSYVTDVAGSFAKEPTEAEKELRRWETVLVGITRAGANHRCAEEKRRRPRALYVAFLEQDCFGPNTKD